MLGRRGQHDNNLERQKGSGLCKRRGHHKMMIT